MFKLKLQVHFYDLVFSIILNINDLLTVEPPIPNATISVIDVTVIETPACFRARAILQGIS